MTCEVCGRGGAERHHCVFRSQSKVMTNMRINFAYLCSEHHRGNNGPHKNRKTDLYYKVKVQEKLYKTLCKGYYTSDGLRKALKLSPSEVKMLTKTLTLHKKGYEREAVIRELMGGRTYESEVA